MEAMLCGKWVAQQECCFGGGRRREGMRRRRQYHGQEAFVAEIDFMRGHKAS